MSFLKKSLNNFDFINIFDEKKINKESNIIIG